MDIYVRKNNENSLNVECTGTVAYELYEHFSFMVPGAKFMPQYRSGSWDGYIHLFNSKDKTLPLGLLMDLLKFAKRNSYSIEFDRDEFRRVFSDEEIADYKSRLPELTKYDLSGFYSYQWEAVEMCLRTNRLLVCSPTGCLDEGTSIQIKVEDCYDEMTLSQVEHLVETGKNLEIMSPTGFVQITDTYRKNGPGRVIELDSYDTIRCSDEHLILDRDIWRESRTISIGDVIDGRLVTNITPVPYQSWVDFTVDAPHHSYFHKGLVHHNSGKSQIIYLLTRFLIENIEGDILIVVPTISLTTQLKGDFQSYVNDDFDVDTHISLMGGGNKAENKRVLISTWQSLIKQPTSFFRRFSGGALIVDECHLAEAKSITTIVQRLPETKFKFGFTGTIADAKCSELQLKGLFGPIYQTKTTKELQDEGVLSDLEIRVTKLKYPKIERDGFWALSPDYQKEVDWLSKHPTRNEFIADLALSQSPNNTLILYNFIEHGKTLYNLLREGREDSHIYLINGSTPPEERERIRGLTEEENGVIIIASSALFSTGVNIRNLTTLIFAHSYKAKIRNLQSIGRSLRLHKDKEKAVLYDITDDLSKGRKSNTALRHMVERVKIYQREGFNYVLNEVDLDELHLLQPNP